MYCGNAVVPGPGLVFRFQNEPVRARVKPLAFIRSVPGSGLTLSFILCRICPIEVLHGSNFGLLKLLAYIANSPFPVVVFFTRYCWHWCHFCGNVLCGVFSYIIYLNISSFHMRGVLSLVQYILLFHCIICIEFWETLNLILYFYVAKELGLNIYFLICSVFLIVCHF